VHAANEDPVEGSNNMMAKSAPSEGADEKEEMKNLLEWTAYARETDHFYRRLQPHYMYGVNFPVFVAYHAYPNGPWWVHLVNKLGSVFQVAVHFKVLLNKSLSEKEVFENKKDYIDSVMAYLSTVGVVAGLVISVVFPLTFAPLTPSDACTEFFGDQTMYAFSLLYRIFIIFGEFQALYVIASVFAFTSFLFIYLPDVESRAWYLEKHTVRPLTETAMASFAFIHAAALFALAVQVSPESAIIFIGISFHLFNKLSMFTIQEAELMAHLHRRACILLNRLDNYLPKDEKKSK